MPAQAPFRTMTAILAGVGWEPSSIDTMLIPSAQSTAGGQAKKTTTAPAMPVTSPASDPASMARRGSRWAERYSKRSTLTGCWSAVSPSTYKVWLTRTSSPNAAATRRHQGQIARQAQHSQDLQVGADRGRGRARLDRGQSGARDAYPLGHLRSRPALMATRGTQPPAQLHEELAFQRRIGFDMGRHDQHSAQNTDFRPDWKAIWRKPRRLQIQAHGPKPKRRRRVEGSTPSGRRSWTGSAAAGEPNRLR